MAPGPTRNAVLLLLLIVPVCRVVMVARGVFVALVELIDGMLTDTNDMEPSSLRAVVRHSHAVELCTFASNL